MPEFELLEVKPTELASIWYTLADHIDIVRRRSKASWTREHVFAALFNNNATLYRAYWQGVCGGFVVLTINTDVFNGEQTLVVWIARSWIPGIIDMALEDIEEIARERKIRYLRMQSPRTGWIRRLARHGFEIRDYILEKDLMNG